MKLNEIDFDFTSSHIENSIKQIKQELELNTINKDRAVEKAETLIKQLEFEIKLSNLTEFEKSRYVHLILAVQLFIKLHILPN